jgi:cytosine/adenosine deaminase-related metal-dependent hydrolase
VTRRIIRTNGLLSFESPARLRKGDILIEDGKISAVGGITSNADAVFSETPYLVVPAFVQAQTRLSEAFLDQYFVPTPPMGLYRDVQVPTCLDGLNEKEIELSLNTALDQTLNCGTACTTHRIRNAEDAKFMIEIAKERHCRVVLMLDLDLCVAGQEQELENIIEHIHKSEEPELFHLALCSRLPRAGIFNSMAAATRLANSRHLQLFVETDSLCKKHTIKHLKNGDLLSPNIAIVPRSLSGIDQAKVLRAIAEAGATIHVSPTQHLLMGEKPPSMLAAIESEVVLCLSSFSGATRTAYNIFDELQAMHMWLAPHCSDPGIRALRMATTSAAGSLGYPAGQIGLGQFADLAAIQIEHTPASQPEDVAVSIIRQGHTSVQSIWIHGEPVLLPKKTVLPKTPVQTRFLSQTRNSIRPRPRGGIASLHHSLKYRVATGLRSLKSKF